jgi:hypothetical protein
VFHFVFLFPLFSVSVFFSLFASRFSFHFPSDLGLILFVFGLLSQFSDLGGFSRFSGGVLVWFWWSLAVSLSGMVWVVGDSGSGGGSGCGSFRFLGS